MLTPTQEHHLKRELLKLQLESEFDRFNEALVLREFGSPFTSTNPTDKDSKLHVSANDSSNVTHELPLTKYVFSEFVLTLPFLKQDQQDYHEFWVKKVQVFYEKFMSMSMSESADREELTKRKKMAHKIFKLLSMVYNSGIGTKNEIAYYQHDKFETVGETTHESKRLKSLLSPSKDALKEHLTKGKFINGMNLNVVGVRQVEQRTSSGKFWNSLTLNQLNYNEKYFEFIIKTKVNLPESEYIYVARRYKEFRELHHKLKKRFPGKELPSLPTKVRSEINVNDNDNDEGDEEGDEDDESYKEEDQEQEDSIRKQMNSLFKQLKIDVKAGKEEATSITSPPGSPTSSKDDKKSKKAFRVFRKSEKSSKAQTEDNLLPREKTRAGLRAYLRGLLEDIEITHSDILKEFLFKGRIHKLTISEENDIKQRENLDLLLLLNQLKFQNETYKKIVELKKSSLTLRSVLLESDDGLVQVFNEFNEKEHIYELSPMLRSFIDWCKIEIAATIYQMFLGTDSSYEFYSQVRKLHKLMPYSIMIQILRFTNPMIIMKSMLDLLMANPFGGKSLLQTMLYGILSDDIKSQAKVVAELEEQINNPTIVQRLKFFVNECSDYDMIENLKQESKDTSFDLVLTLLMSPQLSANFDLPEINDNLLNHVMESYNEYKKLKTVTPESLIFVNQEKAAYYSNIRQLYKIYLKIHDKEILQQLWSQPDLTNILKDLFTMFYRPLASLFRNSHVDVAFKSFQRFMDDLVELMDGLINEIYIMDSGKIVDMIMKVIEKHEDEFYNFLHQVYVNDKEKIFENLIIWINNILKFLRIAKTGSSKYSRVDFDSVILRSEDVDNDELLHELDAIIEFVRQQRAEANKREAKREKAKAQGENPDIEDNWDLINRDLELFNGDDFGLNEHDLLEFQDSDAEDNGSDNGEGNPRLKDVEIKNEQIKKLLTPFKEELIKVLKTYAV